MATFRSECVRKCSICGQWVITEYKPDYPILNDSYDVSNGICLCKRCHKMVHGGGNYING